MAHPRTKNQDYKLAHSPLSEALIFEWLRSATARVLRKKSADFYPYTQKGVPSDPTSRCPQ